VIELIDKSNNAPTNDEVTINNLLYPLSIIIPETIPDMADVIKEQVKAIDI